MNSLSPCDDVNLEPQSVPSSPTQPKPKTVQIKKVNIVEGNNGRMVARRQTSFSVMKATRNGMEEHTLDLDYDDGRLCGSKFMERYKELTDPKKPWETDP